MKLIRGGYLKVVLFVLRFAKIILEKNDSNDLLDQLPSVEEFVLIVKGYYFNNLEL